MWIMLVSLSILFGVFSIDSKPDGQVCLWGAMSPTGDVSDLAGTPRFISAGLHCNRAVEGMEITVNGVTMVQTNGQMLGWQFPGSYTDSEICFMGKLFVGGISSHCFWIRVHGDETCPIVDPLGIGTTAHVPYAGSSVNVRALPDRSLPEHGVLTAGSSVTIESGPLCMGSVIWYKVTGPYSGWVPGVVNGSTLIVPS